jgi:hypothetical protein
MWAQGCALILSDRHLRLNRSGDVSFGHSKLMQEVGLALRKLLCSLRLGYLLFELSQFIIWRYFRLRPLYVFYTMQ